MIRRQPRWKRTETHFPYTTLSRSYAGTGKSAMLGVARDGWERAGYHVVGTALSGIAAENLESGSGIASRTIASLEHQWAQGRELLSANDILVIDEAGMIGSRPMERVVSEAANRGAKVRSEEHTSELQSLMRISYAVFCLTKQTTTDEKKNG